MNTPENIYDNLLATLRGEFIDEAEENHNNLDLVLENTRAGKEDSKDALMQVRRIAHSLKGSSGVADFPLVSLVMHRMEDYLDNVSELDEIIIDDLQVFLDKSREFSSLNIDQRSIDSAELSRQLPEKRIEGIGGREEAGADIQVDIIEAMMVIKEKTSGLLFERELRAAGMRVTTVRSSFEAIEMAVRTKPDIVIVSGVLDELTGVDVASALKCMPKTSNISVALLTSFERGHSDLKGLPESVELIQKNNLKDDLLELLAKLNLI